MPWVGRNPYYRSLVFSGEPCCVKVIQSLSAVRRGLALFRHWHPSAFRLSRKWCQLLMDHNYLLVLKCRKLPGSAYWVWVFVSGTFQNLPEQRWQFPMGARRMLRASSSRIEARSCCGLFLVLTFYFSFIWQKESLKIHQNVLKKLWNCLFSRWFFFLNCLMFWKASNWGIARINTAITVGEGQIWGLHISLVRSGFKFSWQLCYTFARCLTLSLFSVKYHHHLVYP